MMKVEKYLERILINDIQSPSPDYLSKLQEGHLLNIPFENLDIPLGVEIKLQLDHLYEKIVLNKRGGFCYELNSLFSWLLEKLDFNISIVSARVFNEEKGNFGPEFDHITILVNLDGIYLVDVGFGDSFRRPIELKKGLSEDISGKYKIEEEERGIYILRRFQSNEWKPQYKFSSIPRTYPEFSYMCNFHQASP